MSRKVAIYLHHKCYSSYIVEVINKVCRACGFTDVEEYNHRSIGGNNSYENFSEEFKFKKGITIFRNANTSKGILDKNVKGFHVVRDPRDMIIESAFEKVKELSLQKVIYNEMDSLYCFYSDMASWSPLEWVTEIKAERMKDVDFYKIFISAGLEVDINLVKMIVEESFEARGTTKEGYGFGVEGQWKNHFNDFLKEEFSNRYSSLMKIYDYEGFNA